MKQTVENIVETVSNYFKNFIEANQNTAKCNIALSSNQVVVRKNEDITQPAIIKNIYLNISADRHQLYGSASVSVRIVNSHLPKVMLDIQLNRPQDFTGNSRTLAELQKLMNKLVIFTSSINKQ